MTNLYQAAYPNPAKKSTKFPKCGDDTLLVDKSDTNFAQKEIQDYCPACNDGHIDNYTDVEYCTANQVGDLGTFWTANLGK